MCKLILASWPRVSQPLSLWEWDLLGVEKWQSSQLSVPPGREESQPLHKPSKGQRLKCAQQRERKFLCLKLLFFFHIGETQVCTTTSAEKHENSSQEKLVITVGMLCRPEMPTDGSQEVNGSSAREYINICPPGTKLWGHIFQQLKWADRVWAGAFECGAVKDLHLPSAIGQPNCVIFLVANLSPYTWFPLLQTDSVLWYSLPTVGILRQ